FTGTNFTINAERINFKTGNFAISNGSDNTLSVDASGNITVKGTINAEAGYFKGELQGATGTFAGSLTSNDRCQNGANAMTIFPKIKDMAPEEAAASREALLRYCELDTYAMVKVWEKLRSTAS
ncbi:MAG: hypothetical protein SPK91_05100, partial [Bacteroidales bacterium]|nr:hypothetical protein [Bacteroidales bacterium]